MEQRQDRSGGWRVLQRLGAALTLVMLVALAPSSMAIQLTTVTSGLNSPIFAGNAGDGSHRLFIVEQSGTIRILQPGASTTTVFLDLGGTIEFGGEQGLLGLAFHPQYASNGRFFVDYTDHDGSIVIAEYRVSQNDPNQADPTKKILLTIPHPINANHNGGMLAFGPDGYLYIGVGDGGAGDDPPANAQNVDVLLGKILRISVDPPSGSDAPYAIPSGNPFASSVTGRAEIFAYGLRNPWRFSFDRGGDHAQWVADVGQEVFEEVDTPIVSGGNYGWRVFEAFSCTDNDPGLCNAAGNYRFPIFYYDHSQGRCAITGGYVYRGTRGTLPDGSYVYADFCSGQLFSWDGARQNLLLETGRNISSFGEDEDGEIYVVDINGSVSRIDADDASFSTAVEYYYVPWDHYFLTAFTEEIDLLDRGAYGGGWQRTGASFDVWSAPVDGALPTCRFFGVGFAPKSTHFYTPYPAECASLLMSPAWVYESDAFYWQLPGAGLCAAGTRPLYRLYNNGAGGAPNHRYTTSGNTVDRMQSAGWIFEGDALTRVFACVPL